MFTFTRYFDHSPPSWEVVANSIYSLWTSLNYQKGCIPVSVHILLPSEPIVGVHQFYWWYTFYVEFYTGLTLI